MDFDGSISPQVRLIEHLLQKHERSIRRVITRRSGLEVLKRATVDDLYQETVTAAIAGAESFVFRDDGSFMAWITTITRRAITRCLADPKRSPSTIRIKRAESTGVGVPETELGSYGRTPSSVAAGREREIALHDAIGKLPEHYRRVLTLYKLEERPLTEVAARMERSKGATCRLIARAIGQLRDTLVDHERVGSA